MTALQQLEQRSEQRGIKRSIQEGMQKGIQEEKLHIARNMLPEGLAFNLVRKLSGLSEETLMKLKEE
ncbi:MAG: ISNCY family transposase, partial [Bacteroidota bacterium]